LSGLLPASGSSWLVQAATGANAKAEATTATPPAEVDVACVTASGRSVTVSWLAVPHAISYEVDLSQTAPTSGYTVAPTGVTTAATWSGTLTGSATGTHYWFTVSTTIGQNWTSYPSVPGTEVTIGAATCTEGS
jgi:hypothetical protein